MKKRRYGTGLTEDGFNELMELLTGKQAKTDKRWRDNTLSLLMRHADAISQCSRVQYCELRRALVSKQFLQVGALLDKVQCFGKGMLPEHIVRNDGITADTYLALSKVEKQQLSSGVVLLKSRNQVLRIPGKDLTSKQMAKVVRSEKCVGGAKILTPEEQNGKPKQKEPEYYEPMSYNVDGNTIVVTCELSTRTVRVRFSKKHVDMLVKKAKLSRLK